jgi:hypothetical protein
MNPKLEFITLKGFQDLIKFCKEQGVPRIKAGQFECELPARDATSKELDVLNKRIMVLESICQRLSLALDAQHQVRTVQKPFSARIDLQRKTDASQ